MNALFSMQQLPQHKQKLRRREKVPMIASKRSKINNNIVINNENPWTWTLCILFISVAHKNPINRTEKKRKKQTESYQQMNE